MKKRLSLLFSLGFCAGVNSLYSSSVQAQVTVDGTTNTTVNSDGNNFTIENGDRAGANLFHSFQDFSVPTNGSAAFNNAAEIENIFSRVTGGNVSTIDGLIQANDANLFLINPAGIVFGANGRLDIGGSFLGTTADSILFDDGEFSATDFDNPPLLTVNAPIGLSFRDNPTPITIARQPSGSANLDPASFDDNFFGLRVSDGKTFALAGGDITADGGGIIAFGGRIELGAVGAPGTVNIDFTDDTISFDFPDDLPRANISLVNNAGFLVSGNGGGDIAFTANNIEILDGSGLFAGIFSGLGSPNAQAGDLILRANESVTVDGIVFDPVTENNDSSIVSNDVDGNSIGNAGLLNIIAKNVVVRDGAQLSTSVNGEGNGGDLVIDAEESVIVDGTSDNPNAFTGIFSQINPGAVGNAGSIEINTQDISILNNALISSSIFGNGNGGSININATNQFNLAEVDNSIFTRIRSNVQFGAVGDSGDITIDGNSVFINDGAQIQSFVEGEGDSGQITINANSIEFSGRDADDSPSGAFSLVEAGGEGNAGGIDINANTFLMSDRAQLLSNTNGVGNAGNINLQVADETALLSSSILTEVSAPTDITAGGFGAGGDINITTGSLILRDGSALLADTENIGDAGNINLQVNGNLIIEGEGNAFFENRPIFPSQISSTVESQAIGDGGSINISASSLSLRENAFVSSTAFGEGKAGIVDIVSKSVQLSTGGEITAETASGQGGNIFLNISDNLTLRGGSLISAQAFGNADGGNLSIDADFIIAFPEGNNDIIANAQQGQGGVININAESLLGIQERPLNDSTNDINASSEASNLDGDITINTSDINPIQGATELPENLVSPEQTVAQACASQVTSIANNFVVKGKGGVPTLPTEALGSEVIVIDGKFANNLDTGAYAIPTSQGNIIPARGIVKTADGRVILTSTPISNGSDRVNNVINC